MLTGIVVCCAEISDPSWRWIEGPLSDTGLRFEFCRCTPKYFFERKAPLNIARIRGAFEAVRAARRAKAAVIVAHGPTLAAWCAAFAHLLRVPVPVFAHSFNFTELPSQAKRRVFSWALAKVERFAVFSAVERTIYAKVFLLSEARFDVVLWGVRPPTVENPDVPREPGDYICAIGGNARDYRSLVEAAARLPHIRLVLIARPDNLRKLKLPANVTARTNLPVTATMNVLLHSKFMVLPLVGSDVPCGHVTLVAAMHLGKAFIVTDSSGVRDYVRHEQNALAVAPGSVDALEAAIGRLWEDPALCARLGENGRAFARRECTEARIVDHFRGWLESKGII